MADVPPGNRTTAADARRWLAAMPARVGGQRRLLESLIAAAEAAPAFRWLELGGSLARGAGDELSDIDAGLGNRDDAHHRPAGGGDLGRIIGAAIGHDDHVELARAGAGHQRAEQAPDNTGLVVRGNDDGRHTGHVWTTRDNCATRWAS